VGAARLLLDGSFVTAKDEPHDVSRTDGDKQLGATTRVTLVKSSVASGQRLYSEHFPFPGIGKIVKDKDGASWQPESLH
jgi:hypothetical protein